MPQIDVLKLTERIRTIHLNKAAGGAVSVPETDPRASSAPSPPTTDGDDEGKANLPASKPDNVSGDLGIPPTPTTPSGTGENVPAPGITTRPDEVPLDKYATARKIAAGVNDLLAKMGAPAAPAKGAAPQPGAKAAANTTVADQAPSDTASYFSKLGQAIMATDEGARWVREYLTKQAGIQEAEEMIKGACQQRDVMLQEMHKRAAIEQAVLEQDAQEQAILKQAFDAASPEEQAQIVKIASTHHNNLEQLMQDPAAQAFYKQGATDALAMGEGMPPPDAGGAPPGLPPGGPPPDAGMIPGGDGKPNLEQIVTMIAGMVQSGELDPATAEQVVTLLAGGPPGGEGGGPPPEAMAGGPPPGAGGPPPGGGEPPAEPPAEKEASAGNSRDALLRELVGKEHFAE